MGKLVGISMIGIDEKTDLDELEKLQAMDERVEFGVIVSQNWAENGNRYADPDFLNRLKGRKLNLSVHLCGAVARTALINDWQPVFDLLGDNLSLFRRAQLNIKESTPKHLKELVLDIPKPLQEVIIQQRAAYDCGLFYRWMLAHPDDRSLSVLLDGSGGKGMESEIIPLVGVPKVGYAGGINPDNVYGKTQKLCESVIVQDFWVDMESGVRTDDWFDVDKAYAVILRVKAAESAVFTQK